MKRRPRLIVVISVAVLAVVALFALVGVLSSRRGSSAGSSEGGAASMAVPAPRSAAGSPNKSADGSAATAAGSGNVSAAIPPASAPAPHYLQRDGQLSLIVGRGDLFLTVNRITALTQGLGGYVLSSSVGSGLPVAYGSGTEPQPMPAQTAPAEGGITAPSAPAGGQASATLQVRVPADSFDAALRQFSQLGKVDSVSTSSQDVTSQYVDLQARLDHYRAVEARLVRFLASTHTVSEMLAVQDRLDRVQLTIEELTAELKSLTQMTSYSTITLFVWEKGARHVAVAGHSSFTGTFWHSLVVLGRGARVCAYAVAAALPFALFFGLVGIAGWLGWRSYRRRHRPAPPATPA